MCSSRRLCLPLAVAAIFQLAGCAQDGKFRAGPRSTLSVGDKTEVIVSGQPGASIASTVPDDPADALRESKISGRVVDDRNRPVANAKVRLAVVGAKGGRAETVKADSSGAFTLHRLRPGASYVVIAEAADGKETLVGRVETKAPQTSLKVRLYPKVDSSEHFRTSSNAGRARIGTASNVEDAAEEEDSPRQKAGRRDDEERDPPAPEADRSDASDRSSGNSRARRDPDSLDASSDARADEVPRSRRAKKPRAPVSLHPEREDRSRPLPELEDDGENPLPPAIGSEMTEKSADMRADAAAGAVSAFAAAKANDSEPQGDGPKKDAEPAGALVARRRGPGRESEVQDPQVTVASALQVGGEAVALRSEPPARSLFETPQRTESLFVTPQGAESLFETPQPAAPEVRIDPTPLADIPADLPQVGENAAPNVPVRSEEKEPAVRPKWGEVAQGQVIPLDESLRKRSAGASRKGLAAVRNPGAPPTAGGYPRRSDQEARPRPSSEKGPFCRYDAARRRLVDFQLPDAKGRMVSLNETDSDLVLLDFWGTWCAPCKTSIPQLVELQNRFGPRLRVIGIACEQAPEDRRPGLVAKAQKDLGINYPVAITGRDDPSDLRLAMQIQFYPTMILLDRQGQVIFRQQGATETNFARLERAIVTTLR